MMDKLPEGRKALPDEWFIDRANNWDRSDVPLKHKDTIRDMTDEERLRAKQREQMNKGE